VFKENKHFPQKHTYTHKNNTPIYNYGIKFINMKKLCVFMSGYKKNSGVIPSDFCIRYNKYKGETETDIARKLLYTLVTKRIKSKKPTVWFIGGDSGEGKSSTALTIQNILCQSMGIDLRKVLETMNVLHPVEYPEKLDNLLYSTDPTIKKLPFLCIHEARTVVRSKDWNTMLSTLISDVNAMSRAIKPLCTIIISQFIRDITTTVRYTLTYYSTITRPLNKNYGNLKIYKLYKDDRDLEKPKLRKRFLKGYILVAKHKNADPMKESDWDRTWTTLKSIKIKKPPEDIYLSFEKLDREGKTTQIRDKVNKMVDQMKLEMGFEDNKIKKIAEHYTSDINTLQSISKKVRGNWRINPKTKEIHGLDKKEAKQLEAEINAIVPTKDWNKDVLAGHGEVVENNNFKGD